MASPSPAARYLQLPVELKTFELRNRSRSPSRERDITDSTITQSVAEPLYQTAQPGSSVALPEDIAAELGPSNNTTQPPPTEDVELEPMCPVQLSSWRYNREPLSPDENPEIDEIEAFSDSFGRPALPSGWEACEHPEGKLYYRERDRRILTHVNIRNDYRRSEIIEIHEIIKARCLVSRKDFPPDLELVVDVDTKGTYCYYLVSWQSHLVMWAKNVSIWYLTLHHRTVYCPAHLKYAIDWQFWTHVAIFPKQYHITDDLVIQLKNTLSYGWHDLGSSEVSTIPYDELRLSKLARVMDRMRGVGMNEHCVVIYAQHTATLCQEKFYNYHGQPSARLNRDESITDESIHRPRSLTFLLLSPFLFWMPDIYLTDLEKIWVDDTVNYRPWNRFINELKRDWKASTTPATVLLSANVGFLAIQSIDIGAPNRSVSQIASYVSTLLSLATYIVCQILARQHRAMAERADVSSIAQYLNRKSALYYGLESIAFAYSLPIACFIWSMLTFLLAVSYVCFFHTSMATRVVTGASFGLLSIVIVLVMMIGWGEDPCTQDQIRGSLWTELRKRVRSKDKGPSSCEGRVRRCIRGLNLRRHRDRVNERGDRNV